MAKFRIKATVTMDLWKDIEAPTAEDARDVFYDNTFSEIVDGADATDVCDVDVDSIEKTSASYRVRVYDIDYDVSDEEDKATAAQRPLELEFWVEDIDPDGLEEAIDDQLVCETDLFVDSYRYEILEEK